MKNRATTFLKIFPVEIILVCVRWYCKFGTSYRDLAEMMQERGVEEREGYECEGIRCITPPKRFNCRELFWRGSISVGERLWSNRGGPGDTRESSRYAHRAGPDP